MSTRSDSNLPKDRKLAFEMLHEQRLLGSEETVSGAGSRLAATRILRAGLQSLIDGGLFRRICDIGCGDFNWMSAMDLSRIEYLGLDIVPQLIEQNTVRYARPNVRFAYADVTDGIPPGYDLVLCRDVLTHMGFRETGALVSAVKESGAVYFAATTYTPELTRPAQARFYRDRMNNDYAPGYWHASNLFIEPYYFPRPLFSIPEQQAGKTLDIWLTSDLPMRYVEDLLNPPPCDPRTPEDFMRYDFFRQLTTLPFIEAIALYGSRARGTHRPDSDIDLMIWCDTSAGADEWQLVCDILRAPDIRLPVECVRYGDSLLSIHDNEPDLVFLYRRGR